MKKLGFTMLICLIVGLAWADEHDQLAREFFRINTPQEQVREVILDGISDVMPTFLFAIEGELGYKLDAETYPLWESILMSFFDDYVDYSGLEAISVPIIKSQFNTRELRELISFLSSRTGNKYSDLFIMNNNNYLRYAVEEYFTRAEADGSLEAGMIEAIENYLLAPQISDQGPDEPVDIQAMEQILARIGDIYSNSSAGLNRGEDRVVEFTPYDDPPVPIGAISPVYPDFAKRAGFEGTVVLEVEVYSDGKVGNIHVRRSVQTGPGGLDEAAIEAVRRASFRPGLRDGKPVDTLVIIPIEFRLGDGH